MVLQFGIEIYCITIRPSGTGCRGQRGSYLIFRLQKSDRGVNKFIIVDNRSMDLSYGHKLFTGDIFINRYPQYCLTRFSLYPAE